MNSPYVVITEGYGSRLAITQGYGHAADDRVLEAGPGAFTLAGQAAAVAKGKFIAAGAGSFVVSGDGTATPGGGGPTVGLLASFVLRAGAGAFTTFGFDIGSGTGIFLVALPGSFAVSGPDSDAALLVDHVLVVSAPIEGVGLSGLNFGSWTSGEDTLDDMPPLGVELTGVGLSGFNFGSWTAGEDVLDDLPPDEEIDGSGLSGFNFGSWTAGDGLGDTSTPDEEVDGSGLSGFNFGGWTSGDGILDDLPPLPLPISPLTGDIGTFLLTGGDALIYRAFILVAGPGAFFIRGEPAFITHDEVSHDRDRDIIFAAGECLKATGAYDFVTLTGPPEEHGALSGSSRIAALEYAKEEHVIDGDSHGAIIVHGWILITFIAIEGDPQAADEACELMANIACDALDGQSLDLITFPGFTRVTQGKWLKRKEPERRKTATLEYRYLVANWNDFGTLE